MNVTIGLRFRHSRFRENIPGVCVADSPYEICKVTKVARGVVYFRTADGEGNRYKTNLDKFHESVNEIVSSEFD